MNNPKLESGSEPDVSAALGSWEQSRVLETLVKVWAARRMGHGNTETEIVAALEACELAEIEKIIQKPDDEHREACREQFLRNMAFVALTSRLATALRNMAWSAQSFSKRKTHYGSARMTEFDRLWLEYTARFGIDFKANADRIAFVETMRNVRNRIVHEGGEANPPKMSKPVRKTDSDSDEPSLDLSFSKRYPAYVSRSGIGAQVSVSEAQLAEAVKNSIQLVGWLAGQIRKKEMEVIEAKFSQ